jgi:hypothetical protein
MQIKVALGLIVVFLSAAGNAQILQGPDKSPLTQLKHGTAWLNLGFIDVRTGLWHTKLTHVTRNVPPTIVVPRVNDIIEITDEMQPIIIDYVNRREDLRLMSPAERVLCSLDFLDFKLPAGAAVRVKSVVRATPVGPAQEIWVRVEPVK